MKTVMDMRVASCDKISPLYALMRLTPTDGALPDGILPGQFVQVAIPQSKSTFLRRPISVCFTDYVSGELWLLVRNAGEGTNALINSNSGDVYSVILPLGHGFNIPADNRKKMLLVGGGVGVAPLLYLGSEMQKQGFDVHFALGARSAADLLLLPEFKKYGTVHVSTEDGSMGEKGFITQHSVFSTDIDCIACCGPTPMMKAVAKIAKSKSIECEVSLENLMACGLGACLCCVEDTVRGNVCVCTDGPVFNINDLKWEL